MSISHVTQIPDFTKLQIPAVNCIIRLSDKTVFKAVLDKHRKIISVNGPAQKGDFVLAEASFGAGEPEQRHIELGGRHFPDWESALQGGYSGQILEAAINGRTAAVKILSVERVVELELTDENIEKLGLPDIHTKGDYRKDFISHHGDEISTRVFSALREKLITRLVSLTEVELDPSELEAYNQQQLDMLDRIAGSADERLLLAYGDNGTHSIEECRALYAADNRQSYILLLLGHALAQRDKKQISPAERKEILGYYTAMWEKTEAEIEREGLLETALEPFYLQYAIGTLKAHYQSLVRFETELS